MSKKKTEERVIHPKMPGDFPPHYMRGLRDALRSLIKVANAHAAWQTEDQRRIATALGIPFLALLLIEAECCGGSEITVGDLDEFEQFLREHDLPRDLVVGEA